MLTPCPFCGTEMHRHERCFSHPLPKSGDCVIRHYSFANNKAAMWNARAAQGIEARQGGDLERLRASAAAADRGDGECLSGLSKAERRQRLSRATSSDESPVTK